MKTDFSNAEISGGFGGALSRSTHPEPVPHLLKALFDGKGTLLLRAESEDAAAWLTADRITHTVCEALFEPRPVTVWPLLDNAWAVRINLPAPAHDPATAILLHALSRTLAFRLTHAWNGTNEAAEAPSELLPDEGELIGFASDLPSPFIVHPVGILQAGEMLEENIAELNSLLDIILNKKLGSQFQPIVDLRDGHVIGYEALIRGPKGKLLRRFGQMFHAADKASLVAWFDLACQEQCFARAAEIGLRKLLFVNMDAEGLAFLDMHERSLADRAREVGLDPAQIVIEITERQAVEDFPRLVQYITGLREQGFKIAIDDAGAGYNSLYTISEMRPDFVKIDRALVRNLDVRGERRALLAAMAQYARRIGTAVLAEGSETREELAMLIDLGITYGQGYLMGKPSDDFRGVPKETREFIQARVAQRDRLLLGRTVNLGGIARRGLTLSPETPIAFAAQKFIRDESLSSIVIAEDNIPRGLLLRRRLQHLLTGTKAANVAALLPDEPLSQWMETQFLSARADTPVHEMARQVLTRSDSSLDTDIVLLGDEGRYAGILPIRTLLEATTDVQENRRRYADPITGLPNRVPLEQVFGERLLARQPLAALRVDLAHFEAYNRRYGVTLSDGTLMALARLLSEVSAEQGHPDDFIAHCGGDNFLLLAHPNALGNIKRTLLTAFAALGPQFHQPEEVRQGYFETEERNGNTRRFPLLRLEVAVLSSETFRISHFAQVWKELEACLSGPRTPEVQTAPLKKNYPPRNADFFAKKAA